MNTQSVAELAAEIKTSFNDKFSDASARIRELEQKLARRGSDHGFTGAKSVGQQVAESDEVKDMSSSWKGHARIQVKATITSATSDADGSAGDLLRPSRPAGIIELPRRKLRVRQLFAPGRTDSNAIEWPKMTSRTNNAATQAEGDTKAQSELRFDLVNWPVRTIAHFVKASKQILDDVPMLQSVIDADLIYGLAQVEDQQLLTGAGTGTDLTGVYTTATAFSAPFTVVSPNKIDVLLQAIAQVDETDWEANGIVIHPLDWRRIQALKDGEGRYMGNGPFGPEQIERLWNMPVALTKAMTVDKFLVGDFTRAQIFDREDAHVDISTEDSDNFVRNLVTIRAEERLALVIKNAGAFVKGDFSDAGA